MTAPSGRCAGHVGNEAAPQKRLFSQSLALLAALTLALPACASIINGRTQEVSVTSDPPGATISVVARFDRYGQAVEPFRRISITAPGAVRLARTDSYRLLVQKEGYLPQELRVEHRYSWWAYLDVVPVLLDLMVINETTGGLYAFDDLHVTLVPEVRPPTGRD
ncbi:MAG: hypothetical protein ACRDGM_08980 [bacterium]